MDALLEELSKLAGESVFFFPEDTLTDQPERVIAAEMIRSDEGVGWIIFNGMNYANTTQVIAGMLAIGIVGLVTSSLLKALERRFCRWNVQGK